MTSRDERGGELYGSPTLAITDAEAIVSGAALDVLANQRWLEGHQVTALNLRRGAYALRELVSRRASARAEEGWRPIETAPRDGSYILLANKHGAWIGHYCAKSPGGYAFENPWSSMMLNHHHIAKWTSSVPTHWRPLPPPPDQPNKPTDQAREGR